jgi:hypothetical protein
MTVPIDVSAALIFLTSCAIGYVVYRHTREISTALPKVGEMGTAFGAALATMSLLSFLFGVAVDRHEAPTNQPPAAVVSSSPITGAGGPGNAGTALLLPSPSASTPGSTPPAAP